VEGVAYLFAEELSKLTHHFSNRKNILVTMATMKDIEMFDVF
jgi:hypothetical protein